ncbi:hypothetical protein U8607_03860 [Methylobacterium durans]|uniref:hypothetical protein n=1 Tax=Methylobacterium durans TaxID=2202825 RepID=UPI002AFFF99E|nr:hypothetical protein [Methylobacterium durans]MEA1831211.1 hypothetical protein [Methylobacterium durans]
MRLPEDPQPGLVLCYAYLWRRESEAGLLEGRKDRPAVVVLARRDIGPSTLLYVAPVTHSAPAQREEAVEIPPSVKRHLGMDAAPSYIVATEVNVFVWPGPDLRPVRQGGPASSETAPCFYGYLPRGVFRALKDALLLNRQAGNAHVVKR